MKKHFPISPGFQDHSNPAPCPPFSNTCTPLALCCQGTCVVYHFRDISFNVVFMSIYNNITCTCAYFVFSCISPIHFSPPWKGPVQCVDWRGTVCIEIILFSYMSPLFFWLAPRMQTLVSSNFWPNGQLHLSRCKLALFGNVLGSENGIEGIVHIFLWCVILLFCIFLLAVEVLPQ